MNAKKVLGGDVAGKPSKKVEIVEELMEAESLCSNMLDDMDPVDSHLLQQETMDHDNDKLRNEAMVFLRKALQALSNGQMKDVDTNLHAGFQKLQDQAQLDHMDDKPRIDARLLLERYKGKILRIQDSFKRLIVDVQGKIGKA